MRARGWQFTGFDEEDGAAEYIDQVTGESYYHRPSWRTPIMNDEPKPPVQRSVFLEMATRFGMEAENFTQVLRATVIPAEATKEQFAAFLLMCRRYNLDPIAREIYARPTRAGGIQPIVGVDGWVRIINEQSALDGIEFLDHVHDGELSAITCRIFRKDRAHPVEVTEYMSECRRPSETWNQWPARMLRHKALIQCARYAFGLAGIVDPDEFERFNDDGATVRKTTSAKYLKKGPYPEDVVKESDMAAPKKVPLSTQPNPTTDVATAEAAYQMGREAHAKGAGKLQWPGFWRDQSNIEAWMRGWNAAQDEPSERAADDEMSRGND
jgi:phage recombination protein Bet